MLVITDVP